MAKKRKKQEEAKAEKDWKAPEFDKEEYMRSEINVAKATIFAAIMAIPMALAAMYTMPVSGAGGGLLVGLAGISFMWVLFPYLKVDIKKLKATHWLGAISTYFFLFLAVWVMLCNPPFNDFASPSIVNVQVSADGAEYIPVNISSTGGYQVIIPANTTQLYILAQVTDNDGLDLSTVQIGIGEDTKPMEYLGEVHEFRASYEFPQTGYYTISASDTNGNDPGSFTFYISNS